MKIKQLHLRNYGRFEDLTIDFAPTEDRASNVTVIVGNNGAGKSQILQALATGLSWFVNGLKNESDGFEVEKKFIKNSKNDVFVGLTADFEYFNYPSISNGDKFTHWQIMNVHDGRNTSFDKNTNKLKNTIAKYRKQLTTSDNLDLPLIVFYPVERSTIGKSKADILSSEFNQFDAYFACVDGVGIDFYDFFKWFRQQEDIENEMLRFTADHINNQVERHYEAKQKIDEILMKYEELISKFAIQEDTANFIELQKQLEILKQQREKNEAILKDSENLKNMSAHEKLHLLSLLSTRNAISYFTGFRNIKITRQGTPTMIVEKDGEELDVNQLSQGEKSLLALVGDIARRLAILNPSLDDPLQGEGVVMIDEVDLHLHPKWQHDLIDKLVRTFPKVQFILTTHSPHIVSDRQDILVYSLDNGQLQTIGNVYGEDANTVLNDVFHVPYRTPEIDKAFNGIRRAISHKELESAESQINNIAKKVSSSNTELLKVRLMLAQAKLAQNKVS